MSYYDHHPHAKCRVLGYLLNKGVVDDQSEILTHARKIANQGLTTYIEYHLLIRLEILKYQIDRLNSDIAVYDVYDLLSESEYHRIEMKAAAMEHKHPEQYAD